VTLKRLQAELKVALLQGELKKVNWLQGGFKLTPA
jgi:hypothetical protein